ncbi:efflux RND transporter periplasmic adaptor subunit [Paracoccus pacificus]|uniref:Efflux RND transporter periplasmic adaptor subunit n=1 Tax=Paracoccus pacificus TaxID=1463598 RepID=A0ABW4RDR9_9RHOB
MTIRSAIPTVTVVPALLTVAALTLTAVPQTALAEGFRWPWSQEAAAPAAPPPPRPVVTERVSELPPVQYGTPGVIQARNEVQLGFQTLGRMVSRPVDLGDEVKKGDTLAELDPGDLEGDVRAATAAVDSAKVQLDTARSTAERTRELSSRGISSASQVEAAEQALTSAQAAFDQAEAQLASARDARGFAELTAPFNGVVSKVLTDPGAVVSAGEPILVLSGVGAREAVVDLPETVLSALDPKARFAVWNQTAPDVTTGATLDRIEPLADAATRTRRVYLALEDGSIFRLGSLIRARLANSASATTSLSLPESAVLKRDDGSSAVWVVNRPGAEPGGTDQMGSDQTAQGQTGSGQTGADQTRTDQTGTNQTGTVTLTPITVAPGPNLIAGRLRVTDGLTEGQEVVVRGIHSLQEGQQVGKGITE